MFSFLVGLFLFALDNTIVADIQPAIVNDFQSVDKISWLATAFFMAAAGTTWPKQSLIGSFCASFRSICLHIPRQMVLHLHGSVIRGGKRRVRRIAEHQRLDRR